MLRNVGSTLQKGTLPPGSNADRKDGVHRDASWTVFARLALVGSSILLASLQAFSAPGGSTVQQRITLLILAVLFSSSLASVIFKRERAGNTTSGFLHLFVDALIITGLVYLTGGPGSPFISLYLPLIMLASVVSSRPTALLLAGCSSLLYVSVVLLLLGGGIPAPREMAELRLPSTGIAVQAAGLCAGMVLVALATSFLVRRLNSSSLIIEQSKRDLAELSSRQHLLMNEIPDGIIATDLDDKIVSLNQAAMDLLSVSGDDATGKLLDEVLQATFENFSTHRAAAHRGEEIHLRVRNSAERKHVTCLERPVLDSAGNGSGNLFIFRDVTKLRTIEEQLEMQERMARLLVDPEYDRGVFHTKVREFVGQSAIMQQVFKLIARVAPSDATTLICGESGTGKELVAKAIHLGGPRSIKPFISVNCGAIPENLIESELFGHKKGAFTGAVADHQGLFEQAHGGTLFLDEIGELPLLMQAKLLRVLQEKSVRAVGGTRDVPFDVRIIAATNRNLKRAVESGAFREDLYFRLNVIMIQLPALRDRKEDLPYLINSILKAHVKDGPAPLVPPATMQLLVNYDYPGNVRELENILERALVLGGEVLLPEHLPELLVGAPSVKVTPPKSTEIFVSDDVTFPINLDDILQGVEKRYLEAALIKTNGAKKRAAALLGINFRSFRYRLEKFGIDDERDGE